MGEKSRHNKKNNGGLLRKGLNAVPTEAAPAAATIRDTIFMTVCRLLDADKFEKILKVESKYRHLHTFRNDPVEDAIVLYAFGRAHTSKNETCLVKCAIEYYERAKERMEDADANNQRETQNSLKADVGMDLALVYPMGRDMEKAISSHRWVLANCNRDQVTAMYVIRLSSNFNLLKKFEYAIEVLEGSMDLMETVEEEVQAETKLIIAYIGCGEFLKGKAAHEKRRSNDWTTWLQLWRIETGLYNYEASIAHFRKVAAGLQKQEYDDSLSETRFGCSLMLANLLQHSVANEAEAFAIFQEELDRCVDPIHRVKILIAMGIGYRNLNKWDQSIEALHQAFHQLGLSPSTRSQAKKAIVQTYLEQYCTDATLDIDQRTEILCQAKMASLLDEVSTEMHLTRAQLFCFNGDKRQAYYHLELYLDARLAECKLSCYTCEQRVRHGSVPFSCASCLVASYCGRKHQQLTWKNERICHKVLCPLFGYWRIAKKIQKKHKGLTDEDRFEYERVFDTFFESICPHGLIIADGNLQKADSTDLLKSRQEAAQIVKEANEKNSIARGRCVAE